MCSQLDLAFASKWTASQVSTVRISHHQPRRRRHISLLVTLIQKSKLTVGMLDSLDKSLLSCLSGRARCATQCSHHLAPWGIRNMCEAMPLHLSISRSLSHRLHPRLSEVTLLYHHCCISCYLELHLPHVIHQLPIKHLCFPPEVDLP